jgi:hypothetical protein
MTVAEGARPRSRRLRVVVFVLFLLAVLVAWEAVKFVGGGKSR